MDEPTTVAEWAQRFAARDASANILTRESLVRTARALNLDCPWACISLAQLLVLRALENSIAQRRTRTSALMRAVQALLDAERVQWVDDSGSMARRVDRG